MRQTSIIKKDLEQILSLTRGIWEELRGQRIFITGGTGFFGSWLLESFCYVNKKLDLNASALVLTRNANAFKTKFPHLIADKTIQFHIGDVKNFNFPEGQFSHIIHAAATSATETFNNEDILKKFDTVVEGTRRVLNFAVHCGTKKFLYTSSGVAYGKQPPEMTHIPEDYIGAPETTDLSTSPAWGNNKRTAEFLCAYYSKQYGIETKIARCFTFVGPFLPLGIHYAIGNFIQDAIKGGPIKILGDGTPRRSYLYASDLVVWLWTILFKGAANHIYNVGSEKDISIAELASAVARSFEGNIKITIAKSPATNAPSDNYTPETSRAQTELGLKETVPLKEAIQKTIKYIQAG